jgi:putative ATP-binding cassette transporter
MRLFKEFSSCAPNRTFLSIIAGACAGVLYSLLIPVVLGALVPDTTGLDHANSMNKSVLGFEVSNAGFAALFFALCALILILRTTSQILLIRISVDVTTSLRTKLYRKIFNAPVAALDAMGSTRIIAVLSDDVRKVVFGGRLLPDLIVSAVTLIGMLLYLLYLSKAAFFFVLKALAFGVISYQLPMYFGTRSFTRSRHLYDRLQEGMRGLIYGIKELKLDQRKRDYYFNTVMAEREADLVRADRNAFSLTAAAAGYGDLISFFVIGFVAFVFVNYHAIGAQELIGVVMALLYITGPVAVILGIVPQIAIAQVSLRRIDQLMTGIPDEALREQVRPVDAWEAIYYTALSYQYPAKDGVPGFVVGPVDFSIRRGQLTLIVGGNGSGKSTLAKLISLHYAPTGGTIRFGGQQVDDPNRVDFREEISTIFSDYYLFDRILSEFTPELKARADAYLDLLGLDGKTALENGHFSTLSLSDGQRKRIALLVSFLEDKALYLFDEWTADQDPEFREVFYLRILPDLKMRGKAVVVISHDDRYFHVADQLVRMEYGQIVSVESADNLNRAVA